MLVLLFQNPNKTSTLFPRLRVALGCLSGAAQGSGEVGKINTEELAKRKASRRKALTEQLRKQEEQQVEASRVFLTWCCFEPPPRTHTHTVLLSAPCRTMGHALAVVHAMHRILSCAWTELCVDSDVWITNPWPQVQRKVPDKYRQKAKATNYAKVNTEEMAKDKKEMLAALAAKERAERDKALNASSALHKRAPKVHGTLFWTSARC